MRLLIAIDGPAGSGKSTVARTVAESLGLGYVDTGAMYRALALKAMREDALDDDSAIEALLAETEIHSDGSAVSLDGQDVSDQIRSPEVSGAASVVAAIAGVRRWMVQRQRAEAARHPAGAVVEGRDIGTVVLPDASVKIYLDADPQERARRRAVEHGDASEANVAKTMADVHARDSRDKQRQVNPLKAAPDAMRIDTTGKSVAEVVAMIVTRASEAAGG